MSEQQTTSQDVNQAATSGKRFADMSGIEKLRFLGKAVVMLLSGGFAFPNIFSE